MTETLLVSIAEYAKRRGVCDATVRYAISTGRIPVEIDANTGRKLIDPAAADAAWDRNVDQSKQIGPAAQAAAAPPVVIRRSDGRIVAPLPVVSPVTPDRSGDDEDDDDVGGEGIPSYAESRAKREHYQASIAALAFEEKAGRLISAEDVKREAFAIARTVRESILNIPERLAAELAGESDVDRVYQILTRELTAALASLAGEGN